ncbi:MAG: hypothetical protein U9N85_13870 [Bacteroidota bacterium]|nr:hypothetical protein [Bacteroidota bacterium]
MTLKNILISSVLIFLYSFSFSQQRTIIIDSTVLYDGKLRPALSATVETEGERDLRKFIQHYYKKKDIDFDYHGNLLSAVKIAVPELSQQTMDLYIELIPKGENSATISCMMRYGYDIYIEKVNYPTEYLKLKKSYALMIKSYLQSFYEDEIDDLQDELKNVQKDKKKLVMHIRKDSRKMGKLNKKIYKKRKDITKTPEESNEVKIEVQELEKEYNQYEKEVQSGNSKVKIIDNRILEINQKLQIIQQKIGGISVGG